MTSVAVDIGGSGSRIVALDDPARMVSGPALIVTDGRADHAAVIAALAEALGAVGQVDAVAIGAAALLAHGDPKALAAAASAAWPGAVVVVASDALTAALGAWGDGGGAVVAAGTGSVAFATDLGDTWVRADGWGHLLGDAGGAAWIGSRGLAAALRAFDGRPRGSEALLDAVRERYGDPLRMPELVRAAANPATLLASFAPAVTAAAVGGDPGAQAIVEVAADELADTALSVLREGIPPRLALVGGLATEPALAERFTRRIRERRPDVAVTVGVGSPLDGARHLARLAAEGRAPAPRAPYLSVFAPSTHTSGAS